MSWWYGVRQGDRYRLDVEAREGLGAISEHHVFVPSGARQSRGELARVRRRAAQRADLSADPDPHRAPPAISTTVALRTVLSAVRERGHEVRFPPRCTGK